MTRRVSVVSIGSVLGVIALLITLLETRPGFQSKDLRKLEIDLANLLGGTFEMRQNGESSWQSDCTSCSVPTSLLIEIPGEAGNSVVRLARWYRFGLYSAVEIEALALENCEKSWDTCRTKWQGSGDEYALSFDYRAGAYLVRSLILVMRSDSVHLVSFAGTSENAKANLTTAQQAVREYITGGTR